MELTHFTTKELQDMRTQIIIKIIQMVADEESVLLLSAIEKELISREQ